MGDDSSDRVKRGSRTPWCQTGILLSGERCACLRRRGERMKIATLTFMLFMVWAQTASDHNMGKGGQMALTIEQVKPVIQKYVDQWKSHNPQNPLWVSLASPG